MCVAEDGASLGGGEDKLVSALGLSVPEVFVMHEKVPCSLANMLLFREGDFGEAGGVGKEVLDVLELVFARGVADSAGVVVDVVVVEGVIVGVGVVVGVSGGFVGGIDVIGGFGLAASDDGGDRGCGSKRRGSNRRWRSESGMDGGR